jgi:hypothetical protein
LTEEGEREKEAREFKENCVLVREMDGGGSYGDGRLGREDAVD